MREEEKRVEVTDYGNHAIIKFPNGSWIEYEYGRVSLIALPPPKEKGIRRLWKKRGRQ